MYKRQLGICSDVASEDTDWIISISQDLILPLMIRTKSHSFCLLYTSSKLAGLKRIPAILMDFDDQQMMEIALLENIQREDLNAIEAVSYTHLPANKSLYNLVASLLLNSYFDTVAIPYSPPEKAMAFEKNASL